MDKVNIEEFILYRDIFEDDIIRIVLNLLENESRKDQQDLLKSKYYLLQSLLLKNTESLVGSYWQRYLSEKIACSENAFSLACEREKPHKNIVSIAEKEFRMIQELYNYDWTELAEKWGDKDTSLMIKGKRKDRESTRIHQILSNGDITDLRGYYTEKGCGIFSRFIAFKWHEKTGLSGIQNYDKITFEDLTGYDEQKKQLMENTEYFLEGKKTNNILLYGDRGTGKSSSVKALLNKYKNRKLRMIEITKDQICSFPEIIKTIGQRGYRFIIFIDDLSFEEFETEYKYFKAILEGGLEVKPENTVIYATSNRRNIIKETWKDQNEIDNEMHISDSIQEKISLVDRFGITITYPSPDKNLFLRIVSDIANKEQVQISEDTLYQEAMKWEMRYHGFSGRSARQFMDYMVSKSNEYKVAE